MLIQKKDAFRKIVDTSPAGPLVDPMMVAKALGAEIVPGPGLYLWTKRPTTADDPDLPTPLNRPSRFRR